MEKKRTIIRKIRDHLAWRFKKVNSYIVRMIDNCHDLKITGRPLAGYKQISTEGSTNYKATNYWVLDKIFSDRTFSPNDSFVDVGCGKGRLLAYMLKKGVPCKITGIEQDPETASVTKAWIARYPKEKVRVIEGDAFLQQYDSYTIIYIFRPFQTDYFIRFIKLLEQQLTHPVSFYYMSAQVNGGFLKKRPGWQLVRTGSLYKEHGFYLYTSPQKFAEWLYTPDTSNKE